MPGSAPRIDEDPDSGNRHSGVSRTPEALIGTVIDARYRVDSVLGEGGMGLVYRVQHVKLNKPLAIKVLRSENIRDEEVLARFQREAQAASNIGNEHIVDIHDFGTLPDGSTYFVMECLEGSDLIVALDKAHRLDESRAVHIARQLCVALGAAHEAGIVHRDLKPENVFLTRRGQDSNFVKVLDFGIAKVTNRPHRLTRDGEVLGTPHYMSPEQCAGDEVDHRTDIYALGVLLYEMVTGHVPHDADTMMAILTKHMYEEPVAPRVRAPTISRELEQVILRSLQKKPSQRYQTMRDMEADLARLQVGERLAGPDTLRIKPPPKTSWLSPKAGIAAAIGAVLLMTVAVIVFLISQLDQKPSAPALTVEVEAPPASSTPAEPPPEAPPAPARADERATAEIGVPTMTGEPTKAHRRPPAKRKAARRDPEDRGDRGNGPILDPWK